jgi:hypothetical protein
MAKSRSNGREPLRARLDSPRESSWYLAMLMWYFKRTETAKLGVASTTASLVYSSQR